MTVTTAPTAIRDAVAAFAATTRFDEMPDAVQGFGRLLFVDTLGALLGGLRYPPVRRLARSLAESEPAGSASSVRPADDPRHRGDLARRRLRRLVPPAGSPAASGPDRAPGTARPAGPAGRRRRARPRRRLPPRGLRHRHGGRYAQRRRLVAPGRPAPPRRARTGRRRARDRPRCGACRTTVSATHTCSGPASRSRRRSTCRCEAGRSATRGPDSAPTTARWPPTSWPRAVAATTRPTGASSTAPSAPTSTTTWPSATSAGGGRSSTATSSRTPVPAGSIRPLTPRAWRSTTSSGYRPAGSTRGRSSGSRSRPSPSRRRCRRRL